MLFYLLSIRPQLSTSQNRPCKLSGWLLDNMTCRAQYSGLYEGTKDNSLTVDNGLILSPIHQGRNLIMGIICAWLTDLWLSCQTMRYQVSAVTDCPLALSRMLGVFFPSLTCKGIDNYFACVKTQSINNCLPYLYMWKNYNIFVCRCCEKIYI